MSAPISSLSAKSSKGKSSRSEQPQLGSAQPQFITEDDEISYQQQFERELDNVEERQSSEPARSASDPRVDQLARAMRQQASDMREMRKMISALVEERKAAAVNESAVEAEMDVLLEEMDAMPHAAQRKPATLVDAFEAASDPSSLPPTRKKRAPAARVAAAAAAAASAAEDEDDQPEDADDAAGRFSDVDEVTASMMAQIKTYTSCRLWLRSVPWVVKRNKHEAETLAQVVDLLNQRDHAGALRVTLLRLAGIQQADETGSWELCDAICQASAAHSFLPREVLEKALKKAALMKRLVPSNSARSNSGIQSGSQPRDAQRRSSGNAYQGRKSSSSSANNSASKPAKASGSSKDGAAAK